LVIALDTVKRHVSHIFSKLGVTNRVQAAKQARELDLLDEPS
jgi:ATP/maltotriose-dependent transcriptional regulator MalT